MLTDSSKDPLESFFGSYGESKGVLLAHSMRSLHARQLSRSFIKKTVYLPIILFVTQTLQRTSLRFIIAFLMLLKTDLYLQAAGLIAKKRIESEVETVNLSFI
jgi:hypothetical protein